MVLRCLVFSYAYYDLALPQRLQYWEFLGFTLRNSWVAAGWGYFLSSILPPDGAGFDAVLMNLILGSIISGVQPTLASSSRELRALS